MRPNTVKQLWREDRPAFGTWLSSCSPLVAEQLGALGFDWLVVDGEHSPVDIQTMVQMFQAISIGSSIPMARVHWNDAVEIKRILDGGAYGVVVPCVNSPDEAARAVAACRYPPDGSRGFGPGRGMLYGGPDYAAHANEEIACIIQIETVRAAETVDEILSVPGIDAVMIGPADLAMDMGIPVAIDNPDPDHRALCETVFASCRKHRVAPGIFTGGAEEAKRRAGEGWRFLPIGSDTMFLMQGAGAALGSARS